MLSKLLSLSPSPTRTPHARRMTLLDGLPDLRCATRLLETVQATLFRGPEFQTGQATYGTVGAWRRWVQAQATQGLGLSLSLSMYLMARLLLSPPPVAVRGSRVESGDCGEKLSIPLPLSMTKFRVQLFASGPQTLELHEKRLLFVALVRLLGSLVEFGYLPSRRAVVRYVRHSGTGVCVVLTPLCAPPPCEDCCRDS